MTEITSEQQFRLDTVGTLGKILARLESIDDTNKKQDQLFKEHRVNMRQGLKEHRDEVEETFKEVGETIKVVATEQKNLRSYIDKAIGALAHLPNHIAGEIRMEGFYQGSDATNSQHNKLVGVFVGDKK